MNQDPSKEIRLLLAFFGESRLPKCAPVSAEKIPEPYRWQLVHENHMTETLESYHKTKVDVHPYERQRHGDLYGRKLDLTRQTDQRVVMTGLMLINLNLTDEKVAAEIVAEQKPLGRILVEHNVLRQVSPGSYVRIAADDPLSLRFGTDPAKETYGRLATIFYNGAPAVDLLEIVAPF